VTQERAYRVSGRVQGVGYRYFVARLGRTLGVRGGVRNDPDGAVTVLARSPDNEAIERFLDGLGRGPGAARVEAVVEQPVDAGPFDVTF